MKKTLATISLLLSLLTANATHIVGGEFMYKYLSTSGGNKNYQVTLNLYIDCINGSQAAIDQDEYGLFNVFKVSNKALQVNLCKSVLRNTPSRVNDVNYKCIKNKPNACVDKYVYTTTISLPINDNFIVSFERCCRIQVAQVLPILQPLILATPIVLQVSNLYLPIFCAPMPRSNLTIVRMILMETA